MPERLSERLRQVVDALPLAAGMRVLEVGGAPGAAARAVAARVGPEAGALDGRHTRLYEPALACKTRALTPDGRLFVDTGNPLREVPLPR